MLTLKEATDELKKVGVFELKMTRSYKRTGYREVLLEGYMTVPDDATTVKKRGEVVQQVIGPLAGSLHLEAVNGIWSNAVRKNTLFLEMFCKVQLPEPF